MPIQRISKAEMRGKIERYNAIWPSSASDLDIEMSCIKLGGSWEKNGKTQGLGFEYHYAAMRKILWPHLDDHRWNQLCLKEVLNSRILTIMGAASTGKTHFAAWFSLCDYYVFPEETCVLISSTDLRGLELRVWAELKTLHEYAQARHNVPGHLLETKHAIATDNIQEDDVRDLRKGLIGIPCIQNGKFVGIGRYAGIKQKRMRLIADECFPAGTMVDTPMGPIPIEDINPGDFVVSASGFGIVAGTSVKTSKSLMNIRTIDGRQIICTPNHKLLTQKGWISACHINTMHYLVSPYEAKTNYILQVLQAPTSRHQAIETNILQPVMFNKVDAYTRRLQTKILQQGKGAEDFRGKEAMAQGPSDKVSENHFQNDTSRPSEEITSYRENEGDIEAFKMEASHTNGERDGTNKSRNEADVLFSRFGKQLSCENRQETWERVSTTLQSGCGISNNEVSHRSRRRISLQFGKKMARFEKRDITQGSWVDSCEILKQRDFYELSKGQECVEVFNLHVESDHTYSVSGFVVSNCSFMSSSFLNAIANLDKNVDFRAILIGNPNDILDPLGRAAEPKDGWGSHLEPEKTAVWDTRFMNGRCVNLIGTDSPNFDYPEDQPTKFPYLISREKIRNTLSFFAKDSNEYYSQCVGSMKVGQLLKRVLTRDLCNQFGATNPDVVWDGPTTKICALDAAYGGDRCVCGHLEFGKSTEGKMTILLRPPLIVPIRIATTKPAEDQIAEWVKDYCHKNKIPPENFFHDSTGRGSLGTALARIWSAQCNPVEFGGSPTSRPVSLDLYIWDQEKRRRRLKRCDEHYSKFVTELWFTVRFAIEAGQVRGLTEDVMEEFCMREWDKVKGDKIEIESKSDMKDRVGRSPDLADFCSLGFEGARQRGFYISRLANVEAEQKSIRWLLDLRDKATTHRAHDLIYKD